MIYVKGGNFFQRDVIYDVASFCYNELIPRIRKCYIEINIKKMNGYEGTCIDGDEREYFIEINRKQSLENFCVTLCHEMVHVKQYARKEMDDGQNTGRARWKTKTIPMDTKYYDLPWEKEAYRMQNKLADMCWENNIL